jgi:hypothetical protein
MKCPDELASSGMIAIQSFVKNGSAIQMKIGWGTHTDTQTHIQQGDLKSLLLFFKNKKNMLKRIDIMEKVCFSYRKLSVF